MNLNLNFRFICDLLHAVRVGKALLNVEARSHQYLITFTAVDVAKSIFVDTQLETSKV